MSKHTPGPWMFHLQANGSVDFFANGMLLCAGIRLRNTEADACLMAAAPDLLAALKLCAAVCAGETSDKNGLIRALEAARDAIRKAEAA